MNVLDYFNISETKPLNSQGGADIWKEKYYGILEDCNKLLSVLAKNGIRVDLGKYRGVAFAGL